VRAPFPELQQDISIAERAKLKETSQTDIELRRGTGTTPKRDQLKARETLYVMPPAARRTSSGLLEKKYDIGQWRVLIAINCWRGGSARTRVNESIRMVRRPAQRWGT
jgi:hypothetical protein